MTRKGLLMFNTDVRVCLSVVFVFVCPEDLHSSVEFFAEDMETEQMNTEGQLLELATQAWQSWHLDPCHTAFNSAVLGSFCPRLQLQHYNPQTVTVAFFSQVFVCTK